MGTSDPLGYPAPGETAPIGTRGPAEAALRIVAAFLAGLATHPANWARYLEKVGVADIELHVGHTLASEEPTSSTFTATSTFTSTVTSTTSTVSSTSPLAAVCSKPTPLRVVGGGPQATIEVPVLVTLGAVIGVEVSCAACCCARVRARAAEHRSRQPLGASRIEVQ